MTRDEARKILGESATEEQITNLLNNYHVSENEKLKNLQDEVTNLKNENSKYSDYDTIKSKLTAIEQENMTEQQRIEQMRQEAEKNLKDSRIIVNTAKAKEILAGEGIDDKLIDTLVDDNLESTIAKATMFKNTLTSLKDSVAKKTKEDLVSADLKPSISNVNPNQDDVMTLEKFGNLSAEEQNKFITEHPEEFKNL